MVMDYRKQCVILLGQAILLLLCLAPMSYGYYVLVRFISFVIFTWFAIHFYKVKRESLCFLFGTLSLLFQPFVKITLGRTIWNIVDVLVAMWLCWLSWKIHKRSI